MHFISFPSFHVWLFSPSTVISTTAKDIVFLVSLSQKIHILLFLNSAQPPCSPLHLDIVFFRKVDIRMSYQNSIQEGIKTEVILQDWIFEFLDMFLKIELNIFPVVNARILFHLAHDLNDNI